MLTPTANQHSEREVHRIIREVEQIVSPHSRLSLPIQIDYRDPSPAALLPTNHMTCRYVDVVRASVSVGRPDWTRVVQGGLRARMEIIYRAAIMMANLRPVMRSGGGVLECTGQYRGLERTEKGWMSFFLAMGLTKLAAEQVLGVPWIRHLDHYWPQQCTTKLPHPQGQPHRSKRPDLVGIQSSSQGGAAFEVKGRTGDTISSNVLKSAKDQVDNLVSFGGNPVHLKVACGAYFPRTAPTGILWQDPPVKDAPPPNPEAAADFVEDYYAGLADLVVKDSTRVINGFRTTYLPEVDLSIGLHQSIADTRSTVGRLRAAESFFRDSEPESAEEVASRVRLPADEPSGPVGEDAFVDRRRFVAGSVGRDGILVLLGPLWERAMEVHDQAEETAPE